MKSIPPVGAVCHLDDAMVDFESKPLPKRARKLMPVCSKHLDLLPSDHSLAVGTTHMEVKTVLVSDKCYRQSFQHLAARCLLINAPE